MLKRTDGEDWRFRSLIIGSSTTTFLLLVICFTWKIVPVLGWFCLSSVCKSTALSTLLQRSHDHRCRWVESGSHSAHVSTAAPWEIRWRPPAPCSAPSSRTSRSPASALSLYWHRARCPKSQPARGQEAQRAAKPLCRSVRTFPRSMLKEAFPRERPVAAESTFTPWQRAFVNSSSPRWELSLLGHECHFEIMKRWCCKQKLRHMLLFFHPRLSHM